MSKGMEPGHSDFSSGYMPGYKEARPFKRRAKRFQGATWAPPSMSSDPSDGKFCRPCHQWHGYTNMDVEFEKSDAGKYRCLWKCRKTGDVIGITGGE